MERLSSYLDEELDPAATGVIVIACHHQGVFEPVPLDELLERSDIVSLHAPLNQETHHLMNGARFKRMMQRSRVLP